MRQRFILSLLALTLHIGAWADIYQDPVTKVNYEYTPGESTASVKAGDWFTGNAGSNVYNEIAILSKFSVNGKEYVVTCIGDCAFGHCFGLTSVTIPNTVTTIGAYAFVGCSGLPTLVIPNSVKTIGKAAFEDCSGLVSITIPNTVTTIGAYAFLRCSLLTSLFVESGNPKYDSRNNCNAIIETNTNTLLFGCKNTIIPNSITIIGSYAFNGCIGLTAITIPNSVTSIGINAFSGCSGLTSITIPNSVTTISSYAFSDCHSLASITIPNSVISIGYYYCPLNFDVFAHVCA